MTFRQNLQRILRRLGILPAVDALRYKLQSVRLKSDNRRFQSKHSDFPVPPLDLLYEIGGRIRLEDYFQGGRQSSRFLADRAQEWLGSAPVRILDWGCGVACVVRHMPDHFPGGSAVFGSDYNGQMITWAKAAIPGVSFSKNDLFPPLPFEAHDLDWIYGLSVVTHLSDDALNAWLIEFHRILKPGGVLTLTTNGTGCEELFSPEELQTYQKPGIVVRGGLDEGRKMFLAYHHPDFFRKAISRDWEVLDFVPRGMPITGQDLWWLRAR